MSGFSLGFAIGAIVALIAGIYIGVALRAWFEQRARWQEIRDDPIQRIGP